MQQLNIKTFDHSEFDRAVKGGMEAVYVGNWKVEDIHHLVLETLDMCEEVDIEGEMIPSEWKTGFVFGVIQEFVVNRLVKAYGEQILLSSPLLFSFFYERPFPWLSTKSGDDPNKWVHYKKLLSAYFIAG